MTLTTWLTGFLFLFSCLEPIAAYAEPTTSPSPVPRAKRPVHRQSNPFTLDESEIPKQPSAPPALSRRVPLEHYRCRRQYLYRGNLLNCDSYLYRDGERLRPILEKSPKAIEELNTYQTNQKRLGMLAYVSTLGLALIGSSMLARKYLWSTDPEAVAKRNRILLPGAAIAAGSFGYGMFLVITNDRHLGSAVDHYNEAFPEDRIELQFSTGWSF